MCDKSRKLTYICTTKQDQLTEGSVLKMKHDHMTTEGLVIKMKHDHMTSPFLRIWYDAIYSTNAWGYIWWHIMITRSVDSLGQEFLDFLDQASECYVGTARSSWLHRCDMRCQTLVAGHSFEQLGPGLSGLLVLQVWAAYAVQVVPLRSGVWSEPVVWQLCHLRQCQLLWHCIHEGVSACSSMWNHWWCILDSCSMVGHVSQ